MLPRWRSSPGPLAAWAGQGADPGGEPTLLLALDDTAALAAASAGGADRDGVRGWRAFIPAAHQRDARASLSGGNSQRALGKGSYK